MTKFKLFLLTIAAFAFSSIPMHAQSAVAFTWTNTDTNIAACSSTVTTNCFSGFTLTDTTTNTVLATPSVLGATATSYTWTPAGGLFVGTHTFSLVANAIGATTTTQIVSTPATTSVTNALTSINPPTGFSGKTQ
jgi:hypothetical protein